VGTGAEKYSSASWLPKTDGGVVDAFVITNQTMSQPSKTDLCMPETMSSPPPADKMNTLLTLSFKTLVPQMKEHIHQHRQILDDNTFQLGDDVYRLLSHKALAPATPLVRTADYTKPNPEYENHGGKWRFAETEWSRGSGPGYEYLPEFRAREEDKTYVRGGCSYPGVRFRKHRVACEPGWKTFAFQEKAGLKDQLKPLKTERQVLEWIESTRAQLRTGASPFYISNYAYLDTTIPQTFHITKDYQLVWAECGVWDKRTYYQHWGSPSAPERRQTMLLFKRVKTINGVGHTSLRPLNVELTEFSTKHKAMPVFGCEPLEHVRSYRGELKRELAEYVFSPARVMRMDETYGEDWMERV
jgi:hypothetical protein